MNTGFGCNPLIFFLDFDGFSKFSQTAENTTPSPNAEGNMAKIKGESQKFTESVGDENKVKSQCFCCIQSKNNIFQQLLIQVCV